MDERRAAANEVVEWTFTSAKDHMDRSSEIELDAVFTDPHGSIHRVPGFWDGGKKWKVRYASPSIGRHLFSTVCSDRTDAGLNGVKGMVVIRAYAGKNPLLKHGPVRVADDHRHFVHADGAPFFWLGDTWWMSLCKRMSFPEDFDRLLDDRVKKGFTVVQIVAGLYPDMPAFDPRGANEAGYPWERATNLPDASDTPRPTDYARINPAYFDAADRRIARLVERGVSPCIVGAWGYHLPWMGAAKLKQHWRYLVARWGAYPVFWCVAGEANLPYYRAPGFPFDDREQVHAWTDVARYLRKIDPYHRPMSIHPTGLGKLAARHAIDDPKLIDFDMLQTGHGDRDSLPDTVNTVRASYPDKPVMPVLNSEVCYEGIGGRCHDDVQRIMFWSCMLSGACGHTYGANGIWQLNQPDKPYGNSPWGGGYGSVPWTEAMNLPGSRQLGLAKKLLTSIGVEHLVPRRDVITISGKPEEVRWGKWIWYPEGHPNEDAPTEPRYFRYVVDGFRHKGAKSILRVAADDRCTVWFNGKEVGSRLGWKPPLVIDVSKEWRPGKNVIAVRAENVAAAVPKNPAGLLCNLSLTAIGSDVIWQEQRNSSAEWRCAKTEAPGWTAVDFDDAGWDHAMEIASYGDAPWGKIENGASPFMQPYAAETPGGIRVTYLPSAESVRMKGLAPKSPYTAYWWNPITGKKTPVPDFQSDRWGGWTSGQPPAQGQDWVIVLQPGGG